LNPKFRKIKCYKFTWKKFGTLLMHFVKENIEELEDIDLIISLKRGGSILGQSLACLIQDFSRKNTHPIKIRDIPSGIVFKDTIPTFINRLIASPSEINDLPKLKSELQSEISVKSNKMKILVVDDNITTCLRQRLICNSIVEWYGDKVLVKKLVFCAQNKEEALDMIIFDDSIPKNNIIAMPWHRVKIETEKINQKYHIEKIKFAFNSNINIKKLYNDYKTYKNSIYNLLGLNNVIKPNNNNIFNVTLDDMGNSIEINSGSFGYVIWKRDKSISIIMMPIDSIPKLCEEKKFLIDIPSYRFCNSSFRKDESCYICTYLYCSRDIFYIFLQYLKNIGMKEKELKNISIVFSPYAPKDRTIEKYLHKYLLQLYKEKKIPQIYGVMKNKS
jgi:hypothetical protein